MLFLRKLSGNILKIWQPLLFIVLGKKKTEAFFIIATNFNETFQWLIDTE